MDFEKAVAFILEAEGGYSHDPTDPGGETNFGISKRAYPNEDIKNLTKDRAKEIYRCDYWDKCRCDEIPEELRLPLFDSAVNQGSAAAIKMLQKELGFMTDGVIGDKTIAASNNSSNNVAIRFMSARAMKYMQTKNFALYGRGWLNRLFHLAFYK